MLHLFFVIFTLFQVGFAPKGNCCKCSKYLIEVGRDNAPGITCTSEDILDKDLFNADVRESIQSSQKCVWCEAEGEMTFENQKYVDKIWRSLYHCLKARGASDDDIFTIMKGEESESAIILHSGTGITGLGLRELNDFDVWSGWVMKLKAKPGFKKLDDTCYEGMGDITGTINWVDGKTGMTDKGKEEYPDQLYCPPTDNLEEIDLWQGADFETIPLPGLAESETFSVHPARQCKSAVMAGRQLQATETNSLDSCKQRCEMKRCVCYDFDAQKYECHITMNAALEDDVDATKSTQVAVDATKSTQKMSYADAVRGGTGTTKPTTTATTAAKPKPTIAKKVAVMNPITAKQPAQKMSYADAVRGGTGDKTKGALLEIGTTANEHITAYVRSSTVNVFALLSSGERMSHGSEKALAGTNKKFSDFAWRRPDAPSMLIMKWSMVSYVRQQLLHMPIKLSDLADVYALCKLMGKSNLRTRLHATPQGMVSIPWVTAPQKRLVVTEASSLDQATTRICTDLRFQAETILHSARSADHEWTRIERECKLQQRSVVAQEATLFGKPKAEVSAEKKALKKKAKKLIGTLKKGSYAGWKELKPRYVEKVKVEIAATIARIAEEGQAQILVDLQNELKAAQENEEGYQARQLPLSSPAPVFAFMRAAVTRAMNEGDAGIPTNIYTYPAP